MLSCCRASKSAHGDVGMVGWVNKILDFDAEVYGSSSLVHTAFLWAWPQLSPDLNHILPQATIFSEPWASRLGASNLTKPKIRKLLRTTFKSKWNVPANSIVTELGTFKALNIIIQTYYCFWPLWTTDSTSATSLFLLPTVFYWWLISQFS